MFYVLLCVVNDLLGASSCKSKHPLLDAVLLTGYVYMYYIFLVFFVWSLGTEWMVCLSSEQHDMVKLQYAFLFRA